MLPQVVTLNLAVSSASLIVNAVTAPLGAFTLLTTVLDVQRRIQVTTSTTSETAVFTLVGTNQAGFSVTENVTAPSNSTAQTNFDFKTITSIKSNATTNGTVSIGTDANGSSLWNVVNTHVSPSNIEYGTILQSGVATWSIQYTYDDPNNLPTGVTSPTAFNHPTIVNATATIDGASNDPIFAWRLLISGGTGTVRAIGIQAGIGGP